PGHQAGAPLRPLDSPVAVQFLHRWLAVVVVVGALVEAARLYRAGARPHALALKVAVVAQFLPGVFTLVYAVPVALGFAHQAGAVVLLVVTVVAAHWSMGGARGTAGQRREAAR
ncbi:MAG: COX15/CtaA family protein, partial [Candidatus Microthrix sp.]